MKWGIAGYGRFAPKFLESLVSIRDESVHAIATRSGQERARNDFPEARVYHSYADLFHDPEVEIVYVCTTHNFHRDLTLAALQNGKHVICEKPMGVSVEETSEMISAARKHNRFLMEGMWTRYLPAYLAIKQLVDDGEVGEIQYITADFGFKSDLPPERRLLNPTLAGGALYDLGVYPIALVTDFLGEPEEVHAGCVRARTGVDESVSMRLEYPEGKSAHLFSSIGLDSSNQARLYGTDGTIVMDLFWKVQRFAVIQGGSEQWFEFPYMRTGYLHEILDAVNCIERGKIQPTLFTHEDSLLSAKIVDAVRVRAGLTF